MKQKVYDEKAVIQAYLSNVKAETIYKTHGFCNKTLYNILKRNNISKRKQAFKYPNRNDNYFKHIDTEEKAYFLGLFVADGNVNKYMIRISLQSKDSYLLKEYSKILLGGHDIVTQEKRRKKNQWYLHIGSKTMVEDLEKLGITPNKSFTIDIDLDYLSSDLFKAFMLGISDGDGSIYYYKQNNKISSVYYKLIGSIPLLKKIKNRLETELNIKLHEEFKLCSKNRKLLCLRLRKKEDVNKFLTWMYSSGAPFYLKRKKCKFFDFKRAKGHESFIHEFS